jgi:hypothetical protein
MQIVEANWFARLLETNQDVYTTPKDIELCVLPTGSVYLYCGYPGNAGADISLDLGLCREYPAPDDFMKSFNIETQDNLDSLTAEQVLLQYELGEVSINAWFGIEDVSWHLVLRKTGDVIHVTDEKTGAEFDCIAALHTADDLRSFIKEYAAAHPPY